MVPGPRSKNETGLRCERGVAERGALRGIGREAAEVLQEGRGSGGTRLIRRAKGMGPSRRPLERNFRPPEGARERSCSLDDSIEQCPKNELFTTSAYFIKMYAYSEARANEACCVRIEFVSDTDHDVL